MNEKTKESPPPAEFIDATVAVEWEKRLWDIANAITAFTIAQSVVAGYEFANPAFRSSLTKPGVPCFSLLMLALITFAEVAAVMWCKNTAFRHLDELKRPPFAYQLWVRVTRGRIFAILFFTVAPLAGIVGLLRS